MITFRDVLNHTKSAIKNYKLKNDNAFEVHIYMTFISKMRTVLVT